VARFPVEEITLSLKESKLAVGLLQLLFNVYSALFLSGLLDVAYRRPTSFIYCRG